MGVLPPFSVYAAPTQCMICISCLTSVTELQKKIHHGRFPDKPVLWQFFGEVCLLEQRLVMDDTLTIGEALKRLSQDAGEAIDLTGFVRLQVGEGLEGQESPDFAEEVSETLQRASG